MTENASVCDLSQGFVIHASAVHVKGEAWVFLGSSGAGKSTICQLLHPYVAQIADDRAYLAPYDKDRWGIASADARKSGVLSEQRSSDLKLIPLHGVFELCQAREFGLERLNDLSICRYLLKALYELWVNVTVGNNHHRTAFAQVAELARITSGYKLSFTLSEELYPLLCQELKFGL